MGANTVFNPNGTPSVGSVTTAINNASTQTGVPVSTLTAIAQNESSFGQNANLPAVGAAGEVGIMQMTPGAIQTVNSNLGTNYTMSDMNDPDQATLASAQYLSILSKDNNGDTNATIAAYNAGQGNINNVVSMYGSVTPQTLAEYNAETGHANGTADYLTKAQNSIGSSGSLQTNQAVPQTNSAAIAASNNPPPGDPNPDPIAASPLPTQNISQAQQAAIQPPGVITTGLGNQPWYQDTNLLTGNPRLNKEGFPAFFQVYMDQANPSSLLTSTGVVGGTPIILPLNCSIERFKVASRHVANKRETRTGFHITMWGMQPDILEGSGTTGLMMNQFGITDFFSLAGTNSDAVNAVLGAFSTTPNGVDVQQAAVASGNPAVPATSLVANVQALNQAQVTSNGFTQALNSSEPFRIAAEDAFMEMLALFKMNGTTYLHPDGFSSSSDAVNGTTTDSTPAVYSTGVGASDFEIKARNNDVYKRGYVVLNFRNSQYLGYFKTLSWVLDAEKPYQWKFNFTFKVERTLTLAYYPTTTPGASTNNTLLSSSGATSN